MFFYFVQSNQIIMPKMPINTTIIIQTIDILLVKKLIISYDILILFIFHN